MSAATAAAQPYGIEWSTVDGGGACAPNASTGGGYEVAGTIGQPDAGPAAGPMTSGSFEVIGGFWQGRAPSCTCPGDVNGDALLDGDDIQSFVHCVLTGGGCDCTNIDGDGLSADLDPDDTSGFVELLLTSAQPPCP